MPPAAQPVRSVLVASTVPWEFPARIALAFHEVGWRVEAACGAGHPLCHTRAVRRRHPYPAWQPQRGLTAAIRAAAPDLVVPCDDRVLDHLLALHETAQGAGDARLAALIARSVGDAALSASMRPRAALIALARQEGVLAPPTLPVPGRGDLAAALAAIGLPAVLKSDGSWGGIGVGVAETDSEAYGLFDRLTAAPSRVRAAKRVLVNRDPYLLPEALRGGRRAVSVQQFVRGRPANCLAACWQGEVLSLIQVAVERTEHDLGPSSIVRVIDHPDMRLAAQRVFGALRVSGFAGLDFIIEDGTGAAHLIEMNQRVTPVGHLGLGAGRDPVASLAARIAGHGAPWRPPTTAAELIAYFPMAWQAVSDRPLLEAAYHDVPWTDPGLARELIRPPLEERRLLAWLLDWRLRGRVRPADANPLQDTLARLLADHDARGVSWPGPGGDVDVAPERVAQPVP